MTIYDWKEFEQEAKDHVAKHCDPAKPVLSLEKAREEFDCLAKQVNYQLLEVGDEESYPQETYQQLLKLCELAHDYQCALDDDPDIDEDPSDRAETRIEKLSKFLRHAFGKADMCEGAEMKKIAVYRVEVEEMIGKRDDSAIEGELSKLEECLKHEDCTKEKIVAIAGVTWALRIAMDFDKRHYERFAELMKDAKLGRFVPMDQEELMPIGLGDDDEWTEEYMLRWFKCFQDAAKEIVQEREEHGRTPSC